ncbi:beta-galactosidase [Candidatus Amarobacter glycogenicus]|uniref:beta-galactosidase n=1 Tax=Candidatus Amarobacter glycogenicus TaxID=3140699 RepID=UPI002A0E8D9A|nr:beta-galactosidase [Dehalococcoidia bacterium]
MIRKSRRVRIVAICGLAGMAAVLLVGQFWLMSALSWTHREPPADSLIGINFSCDQAEYLLLETPGGPFVPDDRPGRAKWCGDVLARIIDATGARSVRFSVQWDEVEPSQGAYDFSLTDELLRVAADHGASAMVGIGIKAQRHPEFYIPDWALVGTDLRQGDVISEDPVLRARALEMVKNVTLHFAANATVDSWSAENEPYIASHRSDHYSLSRDYVAEVVAVIRANDPAGRPIAINHAQHFVMDRRWRDALADGDVLAQSMYPRRNIDLLGVEAVANIMELGPLMPNYAHQARQARASGKQFWVTELQAEPWTDEDSRLLSPTNPSANLAPRQLTENIIYARKTGAGRIYLWGAEWWLYQAEQFGDTRWLGAVSESIGEE